MKRPKSQSRNSDGQGVFLINTELFRLRPFPARGLRIEWVVLVILTSVAMHSVYGREQQSSVKEKLAGIQRKVALLRDIEAAWSETANSLRATEVAYITERCTRTPSYGSLTPVPGLESFNPLVTLTFLNNREWLFRGFAQPMVYVSPTPPASLPEAMEQLTIRREYLYQFHRSHAFNPPLRPQWQQPYTALYRNSILTQFWDRWKDAYPKALISSFEDQDLENAFVPRELMLGEALLLSACPLALPLIPVDLQNCELKLDAVLYQGTPCVEVSEILKFKTGYVRRNLWLSQLQNFSVVRAIYHPLDRTPTPRQRAPSEFAAEGEDAALEILSKRPEVLVIDLERKAGEAELFADFVNVSWLNHFGGVAEFWRLKKTTGQLIEKETSIEMPQFPEGTWIFNSISREQSLVEAGAPRLLTEGDLDGVDDYEQLLPISFTTAAWGHVSRFVANSPGAAMVIFWGVVLATWFLWIRRSTKAPSKLPPSGEAPPASE